MATEGIRDSHDISHLQKHVVEYVQEAVEEKPERRYSVEITYSSHCYTKSTNGGTARVFDPERYEQSKRLPRIMSKLMSEECHHTGKSNFVTFNIDEGRIYEIYFHVVERNGLKIYVQSAYIRDPEREKDRPSRAKIKFSTILYNVRNGKPIHPPQQKSRRG